jgi:regulator of protease activity HflC (stomatin/prohibitin superfamily)
MIFNKDGEVELGRLVSVGVLGIIVLIGLFLFSPVTFVDTGHVGVKKRAGQIVGDVLGEGTHFKIPVIEGIEEVNIKTASYTQTLNALTSDLQGASVVITVNYNLEASKVIDIYRKVGSNWFDIILTPIVESTLKQKIGAMGAVELNSNRLVVVADSKAAVNEKLNKQGINVTNIEITQVDFSEAFKQAAQDKVTAIQLAEKAQNDTVRIREESAQRLIQAESDAKSLAIKGAALASNPKLVEYERLKVEMEWASKWNGQLPVTMLQSAMPTFPVGTSK